MKVFFTKQATWYTNDRTNVFYPAKRGRDNVSDDILGLNDFQGVKTEEEIEELWSEPKKKKKSDRKKRKLKKRKKKQNN